MSPPKGTDESMSLTLDLAGRDLAARGRIARLRPRASRAIGRRGGSRIACGWAITTVELGELFAVDGERGDERLTLEGDLVHVHGLGARHRRGS